MKIAVIISGLILYTLAFHSYAQKALILGVHPYLDNQEITERFTPLVRYLENTLKIPIELKVASNYKQHVDYIGNNSVDIAYMGPSLYIHMVKKYGKKPLIARLEVNGKPNFHGKIFVRDDSSIKSLHDLPGKNIVFAQLTSTMGSQLPIWTLKNKGIELSQLNSFQHLSTHTNVAYGVLMGDFDAGATKEAVFNQLKNKGLREISTSIPISEHLFVANNFLPKTLIEKIKKAFFGLKTHHLGKQIMSKIKRNITGMVPVNDSDYDNLRQIQRQINEHDTHE